MKILLTAINAKYIHSNLAVYSLKAYAEKYYKEKYHTGEYDTKEYDTKKYYPRKYKEDAKKELPKIEIREFTINYSIDEILKELYQEKPDVLCFSCYIWNITCVRLLIKEIKVLLPDTDIWLGGPEVSYDAEEFLQEFSEPEGILYGEGERVFANLCIYYAKAGYTRCQLRKKRRYDEDMEIDLYEESKFNDIINLNGIIYRKEENCGTKAQIISNPPEPPIDLSELPFPYADLKTQENGTRQLIPNTLIKDLKHRIIYYESSRGCPFSCSYCLSSVEKYLRFRDLEIVKQEIQFFLDCQVKQVKFIDRTFNCKKSHAISIWSYLLEHDNGVTNFHFEISADLLDEEELELLKKLRPGLIQLEIGVQSTYEKTIQEIHRTMKLSKLKRAVAQIREFNNVNLHLDLIAGLPYEDLKIFRKSFNDVYHMQPHQLQLGFLKVLKGSAIAEKKQSYGMLHKSFPPYEIMYTNWMSFDDMLILKNMENIVEKYYNSGQFTYSLKFLERFFKDSFELYYELSQYEREHFNKEKKHARIDLYYILLDFFKSRNIKKQDLFEQSSNQPPTVYISTKEFVRFFQEILVFDLYLRENMKTRPEFALDVTPYKKVFRSVSENFGKKTAGHVEIFSEEAWKILHSVKKELHDVKWKELFIKSESEVKNLKAKKLIYFDYNMRSPLNYNAQIYEIIIEEET